MKNGKSCNEAHFRGHFFHADLFARSLEIFGRYHSYRRVTARKLPYGYMNHTTAFTNSFFSIISEYNVGDLLPVNWSVCSSSVSFWMIWFFSIFALTSDNHFWARKPYDKNFKRKYKYLLWRFCWLDTFTEKFCNSAFGIAHILDLR